MGRMFDALAEVVPVLADVRWWLGRGRFRHLLVAKGIVLGQDVSGLEFTVADFGDDDSDIDLHAMIEDADFVRTSVADRLRDLDFTQTSAASVLHKVSFEKRTTHAALEFVFLFPAAGNSMRFHQTVYPAHKRYECPAGAFADRKIVVGGLPLRIPEDQYLPAVYGPRWADDRKGDGGLLIDP